MVHGFSFLTNTCDSSIYIFFHTDRLDCNRALKLRLKHALKMKNNATIGIAVECGRKKKPICVLVKIILSEK